jgi:hypothetical protein
MDTLQIFALAIIAVAFWAIAHQLGHRQERRRNEAATRRATIASVGAARGHGVIEAPWKLASPVSRIASAADFVRDE